MTLLETELVHLSVGLIMALTIFYFTKSLPLTIFSFLVNFLLDVDHLFDYFFCFGLNFNLNNFLKGDAFTESGKVYTLFHAWEWSAVLGLLGLKFQRKIFWTLALTIFVHLLTDVWTNRMFFSDYSFIFRFIHDFRIR